MQVLTITNQKGGVGKTSTAVSLGAAVAAKGAGVLVVDLDPQANATSALGVAKDHLNSVYGVLLRDLPYRSAVVHTGVPGLDLLPSSIDMAGAEVELVPLMAREFRLRAPLRAAAEYEVVLVDCPPSLGLLTVNALAAADFVLIPVQAEFLALEGLAQLLSTIQAVKERLNPPLEIIAILLTMLDRRNRLAVEVEEDVRRHFPELLARVRIPRSVRLAEAPSHGKPISVYDPGSRGAQAYADLAVEIAERLAARSPIAVARATA